MAATLGSKAVGSIIYITENNVKTPFIVVAHGYPASGRTLLLRQYLNRDSLQEKFMGATNKVPYSSSMVDSFLNSTYLNRIEGSIRNQIAGVNIGSNGSTINRKVFLLSNTELGGDDTAGTLTNLPVEGTAIPYFNSDARRVAIAYVDYGGINIGAQSWAARTIKNMGNVDILSDGRFYYTSGTQDQYLRPAFTLSSTNTLVDASGNISFNTAPVITSSSSGDLGTKSEDFSVTYTVTDAESDAVTVTEAVDGVQKRSYTATLGQQETFEISGDYFMKILNGQHTIKVTATDSKGMSSTLTLTFTKAVHSLSVTLTTPMTSEEAITKTVMSIVGSIPEDAELQVLLTNNANDDEPVWEDATNTIKAGYNHVFTNATTVNGYAFNFKIMVQRGESDQGGYIETVGGAFE